MEPPLKGDALDCLLRDGGSDADTDLWRLQPLGHGQIVHRGPWSVGSVIPRQCAANERAASELVIGEATGHMRVAAERNTGIEQVLTRLLVFFQVEIGFPSRVDGVLVLLVEVEIV